MTSSRRQPTLDEGLRSPTLGPEFLARPFNDGVAKSGRSSRPCVADPRAPRRQTRLRGLPSPTDSFVALALWCQGNNTRQGDRPRL